MPMVADLLSPSRLRDRGFFEPAAVAGLHAANTSGAADNSLRLYALLSFELWCQTFLDREWSFDGIAEGKPATSAGFAERRL